VWSDPLTTSLSLFSSLFFSALAHHDHRDYRPELLKKMQQKEEKEKRKQEKHMARLEKDLLEAKGGKVVLDASRVPRPDDDGTHTCYTPPHTRHTPPHTHTHSAYYGPTRRGV
jgi:hypothetical protein